MPSNKDPVLIFFLEEGKRVEIFHLRAKSPRAVSICTKCTADAMEFCCIQAVGPRQE